MPSENGSLALAWRLGRRSLFQTAFFAGHGVHRSISSRAMQPGSGTGTRQTGRSLRGSAAPREFVHRTSRWAWGPSLGFARKVRGHARHGLVDREADLGPG